MSEEQWVQDTAARLADALPGYTSGECYAVARFLATVDVDKPGASKAILHELLLIQGVPAEAAKLLAGLLPTLDLVKLMSTAIEAGNVLDVAKSTISRRVEDGRLPLAVNHGPILWRRESWFWLSDLLYVLRWRAQHPRVEGHGSRWWPEKIV